MKIFKLISVLLVIIFFIPNSYAQEPAVSMKYTDIEIEQLIRDFEMEHSQHVMPPELLQKTFEKHFPRAYDVEWEKAAKVYEVEFNIKGADYEAYYDEQANLIMYKYDVYSTGLSGSIKDKVSRKYPNYKFDDIEKVVKGTEVIYKIEMERGNYDVKIVIKDDGTIVSEVFDK
ncbi:MAG: hypothetical protein LBV72_19565 [Tannerella sp.]|jgi:uncharacterized membrane protein YkoI|nr:hypothetical protein [Tannerella sp.]